MDMCIPCMATGKIKPVVICYSESHALAIVKHVFVILPKKIVLKDGVKDSINQSNYNITTFS